LKLKGHDRFAYSALPHRPVYDWPEGRRLAVYIGLNLEHFSFGEGLGAVLAPSGQPDVLNYSWRDYGNRVGAWRLLEMFEAMGLPVSLLVNSSLYEHCPALIAAFRARGDEIVGHGRSNAERQGDLTEAGERALIAETTAAIAAHEGAPPRGWLGPWISESATTPDLLSEAGYGYLLDWCSDDQPVWMATRHRPILALPYPQEINDIPAIAVRRAGAREFADMIIDNFDEMREQARSQPLVMGIALHPYIVGQPFRLRQLRRALQHIVANAGGDVWLTTAGDIARHVETLPAGMVPGDDIRDA
jgi:peptidoglycan/xylan/chitin deacetylase (PgdA/CDA1 family)